MQYGYSKIKRILKILNVLIITFEKKSIKAFFHVITLVKTLELKDLSVHHVGLIRNCTFSLKKILVKQL